MTPPDSPKDRSPPIEHVDSMKDLFFHSVPKAIEHYGLGLVTEECGEVLQLVGKATRFGLDSPESNSPDADTPRTRLTMECGDVLAAIDYCIGKGMFDAHAVEQQRKNKLAKLLDKDSKDNLGRRLAP